MATEIRILDLSFPADEDLSDDKYHFVVLTETGTVRRPDTAAEVALGILQNAPESGEAAVVRIMGISKVVANAPLAIGTFVGPEYVGATDGGKAQDDSAAPAFARGIIVQDSGAEDDLASVLLGPLHAPVSAIGATDITLASGKLIIGQEGGAGDAKTPAGDVTIGADGATAIGAGKVLKAMISTAQVISTAISESTITYGKLDSACISTLTALISTMISTHSG